MEPTKPFDKMTVVELKAELKARGLSEKGVKAELLARLQEAIGSSEPSVALAAADELNGQPDLAPSAEHTETLDASKTQDIEAEDDTHHQPAVEAEIREEVAEEQQDAAEEAGMEPGAEDTEPTEPDRVAPEEGAPVEQALSAEAEEEPPVEQTTEREMVEAPGESSAAQQSTHEPAKQASYGPEEWEMMDIPDEYRPLPVLRVRNIKQEARPEDVKKVFEDAGILVHSVDFDNVERNKNVALLRLPPPPLPWKLGSEELPGNPLDEELKKYTARKEQEALEAKAVADTKAAEGAEELAIKGASGDAKEEVTELEGVSTEGDAGVHKADAGEAAATDADTDAEGKMTIEEEASLAGVRGEEAGKLEASVPTEDSIDEVAANMEDAAATVGGASDEAKPAASSGDSKPVAHTSSRPAAASVMLHVEDGRSDGDALKVARYTAMRLNALQYPLTLLGDRLMIDAPSLQCTLYLGNVTQDSDEQLKADMAALGRVIRCFTMRGAFGTSKGYAFVEYATPAEALKAKESLEAQSRKAFQDMMATKNDLQRQRGRPAGNAPKTTTSTEDSKEPQGDKGGEGASGSDKADGNEIDKPETVVGTQEGDKAPEAEEGKTSADAEMEDQDAGPSIEDPEAGTKSTVPEDTEPAAAGEQVEQPKADDGGDEAAKDDKDISSKHPSHTSKIMRAELTHIRRVQDLFSRNLYLASLPMSLSDEGVLRKVFGEFGPVVAASITRGPQGYSKGFGFIEFLRSDHAAAALAALDGKEVPTLGKLAISFVNPSKSSDRKAGPLVPGGRGGLQGQGGRYSPAGGPGRGGMMTPGFRGGPNSARNAPYFAGPGRGGYMQPPPPPPYGMNPMMRGGPGPYGGHSRGGMIGPGRGYGGGYGMGGMGIGGGYGGYGGGMMGRGGTGGGGYGGGYGGYAGSRGGQHQSTQGSRSGIGYSAGAGVGGNAAVAASNASSTFGSSVYGASSTQQQQRQAVASPTASANSYQGGTYGQGSGAYGSQASQQQYASQGTGYSSQSSGYGTQTGYGNQSTAGYGSQAGYGNQVSGYSSQGTAYGGQQQQAQVAATAYGSQQQQQQSTYGNQQAAAGTYPTSYSAPAQTYGGNGYSGTSAPQVPSSTYTAPSTAAGYGAQQATTGYGAQQTQPIASSYPAYPSAAQGYSASGTTGQQQTGYTAGAQTATGYGQQTQQATYGAGGGYGATAATAYAGYGQTAGYGASTQQASGAYGTSAVGYAQQQAQQAYGAYGQQAAGAYSAQAYGQQQVGQKRDGDAYAAYGAGYGADYKRPRY